MKLSKELVVGLTLTLISVYYWALIGNSIPLSEVPLAYRYTFRLYPYMDVALTAISMLVFYRGLMKLKE